MAITGNGGERDLRISQRPIIAVLLSYPPLDALCIEGKAIRSNPEDIEVPRAV